MSDPMNGLDPETALNLVGDARATVRERIRRAGVWFDLAYAGLTGVLVGSQALPFPHGVWIFAVGLSGLTILTRLWTGRTGLWVNGYSPRNAGKVAILLGLLVAAAMLILAYASKHGMAWLGVPVGVGGAAAAFIASHVWRRVYLAEIERGA